MKSLFVLVALFSCVFADVAEFSKCDEYSYEDNLPIVSIKNQAPYTKEDKSFPYHKTSDDICEISAVRINPCANKACCKLKKGKDATISFDFTPNFAATKMRTSLFWASDRGDIAFPNLSKADACGLTGCPVESGKKQELNYNLRISKIFPSGKFLFKWMLYNEENKEQLCCFKTNVELRK